MDLFEHARLAALRHDRIQPRGHYPEAPGYRKTDTSKAAAESMKQDSLTLQRMALYAISGAGQHGMTTEELAASLNVSRDAIQPRTTELKLDGKIEDSGLRRSNASGRKAIVWRRTAQH